MGYRGYPRWLFVGAIAGGVSFVVGALLTMHFVSPVAVPRAAVVPSERQVRMWYFYNAHGVSIQQIVIPDSNDSFNLAPPVNLLYETSASQPDYLEYIPGVTIASVGFWLSRARRTLFSKVFIGTTQAVGYVPLFVGGSIVFSQSWERRRSTAMIGPGMLEPVIHGLGYSIAFGALGGVVGYAISRVI